MSLDKVHAARRELVRELRRVIDEPIHGSVDNVMKAIEDLIDAKLAQPYPPQVRRGG